MKRILTIAFALSLVTTSAFAQGEQYGWSLSGSDVDPEMNVGPAAGGLLPVYLWLTCTGDFGGWASMEGNVTYPAGWSNFGFNVLNGTLNAGTADALQLAGTGCPIQPFLAGFWNLFGTGEGGVCLVSSPAWPTVVTVDCDPLNADARDTAVIGYFAGTGTPCQDGLCGEVSVDDSSWGSIKGLYR